MEENELIPVDNNNAVEYTDDNIRHLSDMEHVRTRPGMYIGRLGDGAHAEDGIYVLLKEVIDNSIDEFKMQAGKKIEITVEENLRVSVRDYGRGIPQGKLIEAVSMLNTGGKYDSKAFKKSVGLNGVGVKAVNALSSRFEVRSYRDGKVRIATFSKGNLQTDVTQDTEEDNGTFIFFEPDNTEMNIILSSTVSILPKVVRIKVPSKNTLPVPSKSSSTRTWTTPISVMDWLPPLPSMWKNRSSKVRRKLNWVLPIWFPVA